MSITEPERNKKKILIIVPSLRLGGQERVASNESELLRDSYDVEMLLFDSTERAYEVNVPIIDIKAQARPGLKNKVINVIKRTKAINRIKREKRYDVVFSFGSQANLVNLTSNRIGKKVVSLRSYASCDLKWYERLVYSRADSIICVSKAMKHRMETLYPDLKKKVVAIQNPFNIEKITEMGKEAVNDYIFSANTIVCHARLNKEKNFPRLIKAVSLLRGDIPDIQLLIIGEGEEREILEELIEKYDLNDIVTLPGFRDNPFAYISKSTLYVLPSLSEGFPNALIEGMIFLPAVAVDCLTGPDEIMNGEYTGEVTIGYKKTRNGYLVEPAGSRKYTAEITKDDEILAEAIKSALTDKEFMKGNSAESVKRLSYSGHKKKIEDVINGN